MRRIDIGEAARSGSYCDICKKMVYINILGHVAAHKREMQRKEDRRAMREASARFMERLKEIV